MELWSKMIDFYFTGVSKMTDSNLNGKLDGTVAESIQTTPEKVIQIILGSDESTKITDVNQFCLEHIFQYLDLKNLLNVAHSNKHLRQATIIPFARKYAAGLVEIRWGVKTKYSDGHLMIGHLKLIFPILRCFGKMITKLKVVHRNEHEIKSFRHIMEYVNEFCAES